MTFINCCNIDATPHRLCLAEAESRTEPTLMHDQSESRTQLTCFKRKTNNTCTYE